MAGDLNLTINLEEIWGETTHVDSLVGFFKELFSKNKLVDVAPAQVVPTWRNGRSGTEGISKRLDRFYVVENVLSTSCRFLSWVEYPFISDHAPIFLQLGEDRSKVAYPFKRNHAWLREAAFDSLVSEVWKETTLNQQEGVQRRLVTKLACLKAREKI
jgi:hypothetical protein